VLGDTDVIVGGGSTLKHAPQVAVPPSRLVTTTSCEPTIAVAVGADTLSESRVALMSVVDTTLAPTISAPR
jgi:hypothetical protein